jgi:hypothetical protein
MASDFFEALGHIREAVFLDACDFCWKPFPVVFESYLKDARFEEAQGESDLIGS